MTPKSSEPDPTHPETREEEDITIVTPPDNPSINNEVQCIMIKTIIVYSVVKPGVWLDKYTKFRTEPVYDNKPVPG